jgi:hypothetical protein
LDRRKIIEGREIVMHARSYLIEDYEGKVPLNWQGGPKNITYWLEKDDIHWMFQKYGMPVEKIEFDNDAVNGLPAIGFLARRGTVPASPAPQEAKKAPEYRPSRWRSFLSGNWRSR